jgi:hypothetical protein
MPSKDNSQYAPKSWTNNEFEFTVPSGDKCLLRKLDPLMLVEHGLMDKLDFATSVVMNTHVKNAQRSNVERLKAERAQTEASDAAAIRGLMQKPEEISKFREVMDLVLTLAVVAPEMHLPPDNGDARNDGWFYTDRVPFNDKMAIFNKVMEGTRVVEQFREGSEEVVGAVAPEPGVRPTTKSGTAPARKRKSS